MKTSAMLSRLARLTMIGLVATGIGFLGAGIDLLGGVDGEPPADPDDLAGTLGGAIGAPLAGSHPGVETLLGDVAAGLEALWEPSGLDCGPGSPQAVGPLGWIDAVTGEDRAAPGRCRFERGCSCRAVAPASWTKVAAGA